MLIGLSAVAVAEWVPVNSPAADRLEIEVVTTAPSMTVLKLDVTGFFAHSVMIDGERHRIISHPDAHGFLRQGYPDLPHVNTTIRIPHDGEVEASVLSVGFDDFRLGPVAPSKGSITRSKSLQQIPYRFDPFYETDEWFPSENITLGKPFILRGARGVNVQFQPFQYNPGTGILRVAKSLVVEIRSDGGVAAGGGQPHRKSEFDAIYRDLFLNYVTDESSSLGQIDEPGELVIIAHDSFVDAVAPLAQWKIQKGIPTTVVVLSEIGSSSEDIKVYLRTKYETRELTYVILVGDASEIPVMWGTTDAASDPSYVMLEGDDFYPDAFISRISASSVEHVEAQVNKILAYEKTPTGGEWYHKGLGIASNEGYDIPPNYMRDWERAEILREILLGYTYEQVDQVYDPGASRSEVTSTLNDGRSIVNYIGHGSGTNWATTGFGNSDALRLENGERLPFIIDISSLNGQWHGKTCLAEAFLRNPGGGAVGMFSSSVSPSWVPPTVMQKRLIKLLVAEEKLTLGALTLSGSLRALEAYQGGREGVAVVEEYNLFGDCTLPVRTATPTRLEVSHPSIITPGSTTFSVATSVADALVSLSMGGVIFGTGVTDESGIAVLDFHRDPDQVDAMILTVTARNTVPYVRTIAVMEPIRPHITLSSYEIDDSDGNGDGSTDYGETVRLSLELRNSGRLAAENVTAVVSTDDPFISVEADSLRFGDIPPQASRLSDDVIVFHVSPLTPDAHAILFSIHARANKSAGSEMSWSDNIAVAVGAPELSYAGYSLVRLDSLLNLEIGRTEAIVVSIVNDGSEGVEEIELHLSSESKHISIVDGVAIMTAVPAGARMSNADDPFIISSDETMPLGSEVEFTLEMSTSDGYAASSEFKIAAGDNIISSKDVPKNFGVSSAESVLSIEEWVFLADLDVMVNITHSWVEDVALKLESPSGTVIDLIKGVSVSGGGFEETVFDDDAPVSIVEASAPFSGSFRPEAPLSTFNGELALGEWKLHVLDKFPQLDNGTLNEWALIVKGAEPPCRSGDVSADGDLDMLDVSYIISLVVGIPESPSDQQLCAADYNHDGEVSIADAIQLLNDILGVSLPRQVAAAGVVLEARSGVVTLQPAGAVGGVEFTVVSGGEVSAVNHESVSVQLNCVGKRTRVAVYSEDARPLSEADLLTVAGQFSIKDLRAVDRSGNEITADIVNIPSHFVLHNPYPNPFNPTTTIRYDLPEAGRVSLIIYDILGRKVAVAVDSWQEAGAHEVVWSAADIPSGIYFVRMASGAFSRVRKVVVLR